MKKKISMQLAFVICQALFLIALSACAESSEAYGVTETDAAFEATGIVVDNETAESVSLNSARANGDDLIDRIGSEYLGQLADRFRERFDHGIPDMSVLILNLHDGSLVGQYGDADRMALGGHAFWPIVAALFIEQFDIDIHAEFENDVFMLPNGRAFVTPLAFQLSFEGVNYYTGHTTFKRAMHDSSPSVLYRLANQSGVEFLFDFLDTANLRAFEGLDVRSDLGANPTDVLTALLSEMYISPNEIARLYASLANQGFLATIGNESDEYKIFSIETAETVMEILRSNLDALHDNWQVFSLIQGELLYDEFRGHVAGTLADTFSIETRTSGSWYVGLYPAEKPQFVFVANLLYDEDSLHAAISNQANFVTLPNVAELAYQIYELVRLGGLFDFPSGITSEFMPRIENINSLLDGTFEGFLYVGRDTCEFCLVFNSFLYDIYATSPELGLYMFDTDYWRENESFKDVIELFGLTGVPTMIRVAGDGIFEAYEPNALTLKNDRQEFLTFFGKNLNR